MYLFNPDNDLALANFNPHYTPPASVVKMAEDLAVLPLWYAPSGSKIVAEGDENSAFLKSMQAFFSMETELIPLSEIGNFPTKKIVPWGWNPALRKKLLEANVPEEQLPAIEELKRLRNYSGRQYAVQMLRELQQSENGQSQPTLESSTFCGESHYFTSIDTVLTFLATQSGNNVLKMPYSGSGKGLVWVLGEITDKQTDWVRRVLKTQNGIVVEPVMNKKYDFAMEFYMENSKVCFVGYSLFRSSPSGAYMGNILMPDVEIEKQLSEFVSSRILHQLCELLKRKLSFFFPFYTGYLGVDMMICQTSAGYRVQPCVEINMRMNMGLVAHTFYKRFVKQGVSGQFRVNFFKKTGEALEHHRQMMNNFPPVIENRRIKQGYLSLVPVNERSSYVAYVIIST